LQIYFSIGSCWYVGQVLGDVVAGSFYVISDNVGIVSDVARHPVSIVGVFRGFGDRYLCNRLRICHSGMVERGIRNDVRIGSVGNL
jgi:hypothetical protein